ncbi:MAG: ABC transporter permease [Bryobacteraceae bacterium]
MRRYLSLLGHYFLQYAKVRLAYRGDFFLSVATTATATLFGIAVVFLIFGRIESLLGWTFHEILFLYGFSLLPLSLFNMLSINLYYFSETYIVQGKFDRVLLRPLHSLFQILFEQFRLESLGDAAVGIVVMAISAGKIGLAFGWLDLIFLAAAAIAGCVIYLSIFLMLTAVSFWMEDRVGIIPPVYNMLTFGRYPLDIYNGAIRIVLSWVVPFGFASFYPAASVLRRDVYQVYAWLLPVVMAVFLVLAVAVWNRGVRNYASTGS